MIEDIQKHFAQEYPREGCGVIALVKGKKQFFPCQNVAPDDDDFIISYKDYFKVKEKYDIIGIVHSHPDNTNKASQADIDNCNVLGIPYYIFSYPAMELNILEPKKNFQPLIGREYKFGTADCFEAARDWLAEEGINIPPRDTWEDNWWESTDHNYFTEEKIERWGFKKVDKPQKNDVLVFQIKSKVPNHCGVYLGNDIMFHHAHERLSCRESILPLYLKNLVGVYRHET
jgi:proteasome lid subunit RPN8/RPN11